MSSRLRRDQECTVDGCGRPAHIGELCAWCWMAASPARRAVELACGDVKASVDLVAEVTAARVARRLQSLEALFSAPSYEPRPGS
jgi:hypothetical protein